jgi:phage/plasmid-like protein (TIGR03299 family)
LPNKEAFDFLDSLVENGAKFEKAGEYNKGRSSFIAVSSDPFQVMGDECENYILCLNSFDGSGTIKVMFTPVRVYCQNTIALAIKKATSMVSIRHSTDVQSKLNESRKVLLANEGYKDGIIKASEELAATTFTEAQFVDMITGKLLKLPDDASNTIVERFETQLQQMLNAYRAPDLGNFDNTAYKAVQAIADFESHKPVFRDTKNPYANFNTVIMGMPMLNTVYQMVRETV